ncbi:MAG TPA: citrate synthase [Acidimicrobiales bacterium]|nr:citrate synthase [Acidimicrobiales bacterium]
MGEMVDSAEAARRLGIKLATLYSYVSRGILQSHPAPEARRRLFDLDEVERIARRGKSGRQADDHSIRITTAITQLLPTGPRYRGIPAVELATTASFEEVAALLWESDAPAGWVPLELPPAPEMTMRNRLKWSIMMSGARASLASDLRRPSIVEMATALLATIVDCLPPAAPPGRASELRLDGGRTVRGSLAERLADRLAEGGARPEVVRAVNAALVVLADHELTPPALAVRIAASARATYFDAMLVGVSASSARAQGSASELAHALLQDAESQGAEQAMDDALRHQGVLPGFGRREYPDGDPRFSALQQEVERVGTPERFAVVRAVLELADLHQLPRPSVDFGLAAIMFAADMPRAAGLVITTIARLAGWTAHFLEELDEEPLRFRPQPVYVGAT